MPLDLVYFLKQNGNNIEFRYSLRSVAKHVPHNKIWVIGYLPPWAQNINHIPVEQIRCKKWENLDALHYALFMYGPERYALMNDDFYALEPTKIPGPMHGGPLKKTYSDLKKLYGGHDSVYMRAILATNDYLNTVHGIANPLSYALHMPMEFERDALADIYINAKKADFRFLLPRSLYGNILRLGGEYQEDVKIHPHSTRLERNSWISCQDNTFQLLRILLEHKFPDMCVYESDSFAPYRYM